MWKFFVNNLRFTTVIVLALSLLGALSILAINKESNPEVNVPFVIVSTAFPGANAVDVEEFVTNPLEDAVLGLEDVVEVTSTSGVGFSSIVLEFSLNADVEEKLVDTKDVVDLAAISLPSDATDPIVQQISFDDTPIKVFALAGPYDVIELKNAAEELKENLERIPGVTEANIIGGENRQVRVLLDRAKMDQFNLSVRQVTNTISLANSNIPVGEIEQDDFRYSIRFDGKLTSVEDIRNVPITTQGGNPVFVRDVAVVLDGFEERTSSARLTTNDVSAQNAVTVSILKKSGGNILNIVDAVDAEIERAKTEYFPEGVTVEIIDDFAEFIRKDLGNLSVSGLQTTGIVVLLILVLLGWREALLAGFGVPLSFFITFIFLLSFGFTLNFLSLFALILSLGILVDASIVMTEGIYANVKKGMDAKNAALAAIDEFKTPLIAGTATTIFAFLPMLLTGGIIGEFIKSIPVTVSIVLIAALFVALAVIPTFASVLLDNTRTKQKRFFPKLRNKFADAYRRSSIPKRIAAFEQKRDQIIARLQGWYAKILQRHLESKTLRRRFAATLILGFVFSLALPVSGLLKVDMFPAIDEERVYIDYSLGAGSTLQQTEAYGQILQEYFDGRTEVESFIISAGAGSSVSGGSGAAIGSATINLIDGDRPDSRDLLEIYDTDLKPLFAPATITVQQLGSGPEQGAPVEVEIVGEDLDTLERIAIQLESVVEQIEGTRNVSTSIQETPGEFVFELDRDVLGYYGLSAIDVASTLRTAVFGSEATEIRVDGEDIDVVVAYKLNETEDRIDRRSSLQYVTSLTVPTQRGDVPLDTFISTELGQSRGTVQHEAGDRVVRVTSGVGRGVVPQDIFTEIQKQLPNIDVPEEYEVRLAGQNEDTAESFADLGRAMILGIFAIAALLIWQFNSFRQPLFIISSIPLALIGVLPGLTLIQVPLSFPGMIGVVALAGIVVNNGIILVDKINENRRQGLDRNAAIKEAAESRLRPIVLTTITTVAGLLPLVISQPSWAPLGFAIIFGLLFSTVLTLLSVPLLYQRFGEETIA